MILNQKLKDFKIILASASPRRHDLLKGMGINFEACSVNAEEIYPDKLQAAEVPEYLSRLKAEAFSIDKLDEKTILITADTIVWKDKRVIEKPKDRQDAVNILKDLSASMHEVFTAVCFSSIYENHVFSNRSAVWFRKLSEEEIDYYIDNCQPFDKAGSYGVQEWIGYIGIERIEGSYFNVMGLPTQQLYLELDEFVNRIIRSPL